MSQHDFVLSNQNGADFRADLNLALEALVTNSSGGTAPEDTFAYMFWVDTSGGYPILKMRNGADDGWITIGRLDVDNFQLNTIVSGSAAPSAPFAYQHWVDTSGENPLLKIRNGANDGWVTIGRVDLASYGALPLTGGTLSGALILGSADALTLPVGDTDARPGVPVAGMMRFNDELETFEGYRAGSWGAIGGGGFVVATVQTITASGTITSSTSDNRQLRTVKGDTGGVSASTTPFGSGGGWKDGTEIRLIGTSNDDPLILTYNDAANGLVGDFATLELTRFKYIDCTWSAELSRWIKTGGNV